MERNLWIIASNSITRGYGHNGSTSLWRYELAWDRESKELLHSSGTQGVMASFRRQPQITLTVSYMMELLSHLRHEDNADLFKISTQESVSKTFQIDSGTAEIIRSKDRKTSRSRFTSQKTLTLRLSYDDQSCEIKLGELLINQLKKSAERFSDLRAIELLRP